MNTTTWSLFGLPRTGAGKTAILGVVYDSNSYLGKGAAVFPVAIRLATNGIEWEENGKSVHNTNSVDVGDVIPGPDSEVFLKETRQFLENLWDRGFRKFLVLGGNHAITIPVIQFLKDKGIVKTYVQFDAHADAREEDRGTKYSFACVFRRVSEILGPKNCSLIGIRSVADEEADFVKNSNVIFGKNIDMEKVNKAVSESDYISIDMDVFENASVTNPEPYEGMTLSQILHSLSGKKVGVDIVEGIPKTFFGDDTSTAAALIARKSLFMLGSENE